MPARNIFLINLSGIILVRRVRENPTAPRHSGLPFEPATARPVPF